MAGTNLIEPKATDELFLYRLSRLRAAGGRRVIRLCEGEFGITRREWGLLGLLARDDGILSSQLAERAHLDRARTSRAVSGLVAKGLVRRTVRTGDRRAVALHLTEQGQAVNAALLPRVAAINRELLSVLSASELDLLDDLLLRLQAQADAMTPDADGPKADRRRGRRARRA
jgi:DNA-binding MarR family transcriptional regulator